MSTLLVWQQGVWQKLMRNREFRCHALLLKGRKGIGKFTFARILAKSLLCINPDVHNVACENCVSCNWFEQHSHPNFAMILPETLSATLNKNTGSMDSSAEGDTDQQSVSSAVKRKPSQQIGIDQIRRLNDLVYMSGHQEGYKVVLLYPAEAMNMAAANAVLKKLEEPPEKTLFILVSHQPQRLLPTVRSRCQQINMPIPDRDTAVRWLDQHQQGNNNLPDASIVLAMSGFSPLAALSIHENIKLHEQFIEYISMSQHFDSLAIAEKLQNHDLATTVDWLQKWCYDLASYHAAGRIRYHPHLETRIQVICRQIDQQACMDYIDFLNTRQPLTRHSVNGRLFLEELLINYGKLIVPTLRMSEFAEC